MCVIRGLIKTRFESTQNGNLKRVQFKEWHLSNWKFLSKIRLKINNILREAMGTKSS